MKNAILCCALLFSLTINAQVSDKPVPIDISEKLSPEQFDKIVDFVLKRKKTMTYCNMYNDNPYHEFEGNIELYLNPKMQLPTKEEAVNPDTYDEFTLRLWDDVDYPFLYSMIRKDEKTDKVYFAPYWKTTEPVYTQKRKLYPVLDRIIREVENDK